MSWEHIELNECSRAHIRRGRSTAQCRPVVYVDPFRLERQLLVHSHRRYLIVVSIKHRHPIPWPRTDRDPARLGKHKGLLVHLVSLLQNSLHSFIYT